MGVTATEMRKTGSVLEELTNVGWGTDKQTIVKQLARAVIKDVSQVYAVRRKSAETRLSVCVYIVGICVGISPAHQGLICTLPSPCELSKVMNHIP